jgi:23S rRNA U2552 (ribose-2'-O)-methylase RlmE/FtsJ
MTTIEAKKDDLFNEMKKLAKKNWKLDTFEREQGDKFIENQEQLQTVGQEIFDNFGLIKTNIKLFADICSAPGMYSKIVLDTWKKTSGIGISLPVDEGGVPYTIKNPRYKFFYKNILDKSYKLELNENKNLKLDLGLASCVSYKHDARNAFYLNMELIVKSLMLILPNLKLHGNLIINMTIKNVELAFNMVNILAKLFKSFKLWKSPNIWATKNTFYFFGYDFKENYNSDILTSLIESIKINNSPINNYFIGTNDEYNKIYEQMKQVYNTRIKAWKTLIYKSKKV